ncbi:sperm-associated antigen 16 protein isoform X1 [Coturnix japonica]|uniref:Sperm associated antigen 16 n=1 Tax=Coturnix japonica TaxID=93934 RepID=A0A8C2TTG2_COTJA|nr:sperm-associated antigen 16 protein isoform X1 [Coturnix japonica]
MEEQDEEEASGSEVSVCLQKITITDYSEDDYQYEEVSADDEFSLQEGDEDLSEALQAIQEQAEDARILASKPVLTSEKSVSEVPEAMDDFFCNFLVSLGMSRTLDCFQTEWYELVERGAFTAKDIGLVPTVYTCNQQLKAENMRLREDLDNYKRAANKAKEAFLKMQKERDFHRMHHKQAVQEKNRLLCDIKRLKAHYASYEPVLKQLTEKYQTALRQKMLTSLERDRAVGQVTGLQAILCSLESGCALQIPVKKAGRECERKKGLQGSTQKALQEARQQKMLDAGPAKDSEKKRYPKDSEFPVDSQVNSYIAPAKVCSQSLEHGEYKLEKTLKLHDAAVSCLASHPLKDMVVTGSDDHLWKMWALAGGSIIMVGEGHTDWVSGCCFHPSGTQLVTSSGDATVRIWDLSKEGCVLTLKGHAQAVWDCSWHSCGDFVASASKDSTSKIWDVNSERCRYTMRGHKDSVSSIEFLPFSNIVLTSSADKTLSLWDARTGLRVCTFYGHLHPCNHATFSPESNMIASVDTCGVLKLWDVRQADPIQSVDTGPRSANQVAFDYSGHTVAVASSDGAVKVVQPGLAQLHSLQGYGETEVQSVAFHHLAERLLSGAANGTVCLWTSEASVLSMEGTA